MAIHHATGFRYRMAEAGNTKLQERRFVLTDTAVAESSIAHPLLRRLYRLWLQKCDARPAPSRSDFSIEELRPWLGHLMVLDCLENGDFRYRLYSTDLVGIFGFDLTNRLVSAAAVKIGDKPFAEYRQVRASGLPSYVARGTPSSRDYLAMDKLALPLMENGVVVKILAAIYLSEA